MKPPMSNNLNEQRFAGMTLKFVCLLCVYCVAVHVPLYAFLDLLLANSNKVAFTSDLFTWWILMSACIIWGGRNINRALQLKFIL